MSSENRKHQQAEQICKRINSALETCAYIQALSVELLNDSNGMKYVEEEVLRVMCRFAVIDKKEIRVPVDWWDHFKLRWFPAFMLKKWPVEYRVLTYRSVLGDKIDKYPSTIPMLYNVDDSEVSFYD